ncbi:cytochrome c family protein [Sphingomonas sp. ASV193]|uniref:c-type cytochrome n=1 Tax=Sphingomonas sp. ASV193 TaxID=3144405 RepID=UPI0032E861C2
MNDRNNTIAGWVLFAGIVALGTSIVSGHYFNDERPEKMGYPIEGVVEEGDAGGGAAAEQPAAFYLSKADATKGAEVFKKCAACHNADQGGANAIGPNLWGVVGEAIGQGANGYAFSEALSKKGGKWDFDSLFQWLKSPKAFAPGTKMGFAGLSDPQDRANVIAFLNSHGTNLPLPAAPAAAPAGDAKAGAAAGNAAAPAGAVDPKVAPAGNTATVDKRDTSAPAPAAK